MITEQLRVNGVAAILSFERLDDSHYMAKITIVVNEEIESEIFVLHTVQELHEVADKIVSVFHAVASTCKAMKEGRGSGKDKSLIGNELKKITKRRLDN